MSNNYKRDYQEELLLSSGGNITKTIHSINVDASPEQIKDIILCNHSNLKSPSQRLHVFNSIQQRPDEALQTYNSRYESHFKLVYPDVTINDTASRTRCIHYASLPHSKLGDEMEGSFNQDLPESLQVAFKKAMNFEPHILTKQTINTRRMNKVNHINVNQYDSDLEINEVHVTYKGKYFDSNYQNKNKTNGYSNNSSNNSCHSVTGYTKNYSNKGMSNSSKNTPQDKPTKVQVTLTGPVNREQLFKIQEVLRHPWQYREKLPPNARPATGGYTKSFNKFIPKKLKSMRQQ